MWLVRVSVLLGACVKMLTADNLSTSVFGCPVLAWCLILGNVATLHNLLLVVRATCVVS